MILSIKDLSVKYHTNDYYSIKNLYLDLKKGESIGIVGESGCGKTTLLSSIMGLLNKEAMINGEILYSGSSLVNIKKDDLNKIRWNKISMVFQNSLKYLNPSIKVLDQITETFKKVNTDKAYIYSRVEELCNEFDLDYSWLDCYPSQLSGGMRQRIFIIMALALDPSLILIDEPTTSLENINKNKLVSYFEKLRKNKDVSLIIVSHNLNFIERLTDKAMVMHKGNVVEYNTVSDLLRNPKHPYTRALILSSTDINPYKDLWGIKPLSGEETSGCSYYNYCTQRLDKCLKEKPVILKKYGVSCLRNGIIDLLLISNISKKYKSKEKEFYACENCSFKIAHGEIISIIGESGSGKTTLARIISGFIQDYEGKIVFNDEEFKNHNKMSVLNGVQMISQDPYSSINPHFSVGETILEPIIINNLFSSKDYDKIIEDILESVDLKNVISPETKASSLSGGQIQRIAIARALVMKPKLLIADEITSSLDVSAKVNILRLLKKLQNTRGFSMIYITHDLKMAAKISDKIIVMKNARIVESGLTQDIFENPINDYTKKLVRA